MIYIKLPFIQIKFVSNHQTDLIRELEFVSRQKQTDTYNLAKWTEVHNKLLDKYIKSKNCGWRRRLMNKFISFS